jgi:hypothetical protein
MPEKSSIRKFIEAVNSGQTKTTKVLNRLFEGKTASYNGAMLADAAHLGQPNSLNQLQAWAKDELRKPGNSDPELALSDADLDHFDSWPPGEKEKVRQALVAAVGPPGGPSRDIHFSWALYAGTDSATQLDPPGLAGTGDIRVTFLSPNKNVTKSPVTFGEVHVEI